MTRRPPIRAVLFDKDGTLFDLDATWSVYCERVIAALAPTDAALRRELARRCGYDPRARRLQPRSVLIAGSAAEVEAALRSALPQSDVHRVAGVARAMLNDLPLAPLGDLPWLMQELRAMGLRLGLATNDYCESAHRQLAAAGVGASLDFVCGSDSGFGAKPEPGMIRAFARHLGCETAEIAMVGDSLHDLDAGRAAGCGLVVAMATGHEASDTLGRRTAHVVGRLDALPGYISTYTACAGV